MSDKLIDTFHLRRKLNADIETLGDTANEKELNQQVREITQKYDADLILTVLMKFLNTSSSQVRGGLGRLASLLPYEEITAALRREAANRNNPTQARLTAALILERFLQAEIPPASMSDLKDPEIVVKQSLDEAVEEGKQNHYILLEYVRQMRQENEDVAYMVLDLIDRLPATERPELLRLIAYDMRDGVASAAIDGLAMIREQPAAQQAAEALHTLQFNQPPQRREQVERSLRKLRFSGVDFTPSPMTGWRALLSPCSLQGAQDLWFIHTSQDRPGTLIGLRLNVEQGLMDTFGSEDVEAQYLPPKRQIGEMMPISMSSSTPTVFLEVPVDYARWFLQRVLETHWQQSPKQLPDEYSLYNIHIYRHSKPEPDQELLDFLNSGSELWARSDMELRETASDLLHQPSMANWFMQKAQLERNLPFPLEDVSPGNLREIVDPLMEHFTSDARAEVLPRVMQSALRSQAGWLAIAGQRQNAEQALYLAESLDHVSLAQHPMLLLIVEVSVMLLFNQRKAKTGSV